jgi:hypothetical protein
MFGMGNGEMASIRWGAAAGRGRLLSLSQAMKRRWQKIAIHVKPRKGLSQIRNDYCKPQID